MFRIEVGGQSYTFMTTKEFAQFTGESADSLYKKTADPARVKWGASVYWVPELLAMNILPKGAIGSQFQPLKLEDFETRLKAVGGAK